MKKLRAVILTGTAIVIALTSSANTLPSNITMDGSAPVVSIWKNASSELGNFGANTVTSWLEDDIEAYSLYSGIGLPELKEEVSPTLSTGKSLWSPTSDGVSFNVQGAYDYVVLHWGGGENSKDKNNAKSGGSDKNNGGGIQAYYLGGINLSGVVFEAPDKYGFSGARFYRGECRQVPDAGTTAGLLGIALAGLAAWSRKLRS
jgi:hypothetical protein